MGGYLSSSDKGDEGKLLQEYKVKLYALEDAVLGLFKVLDVVDAAASSLEYELQVDFDCTDKNVTQSRLEQYRKLAARLLTTSKCAMLYQKKLANASIISLINFINDGIIRNANSVEVTIRKISFENAEGDRQLLNSGKEMNRFEALLNKTEEQANEIKSLNDRIESMKEKETTFFNEEKLQRNKILLLENEKETLREEKDALQSKLQTACAMEIKYKRQLEERHLLQKEHQKELAGYKHNLFEKEESMKTLGSEREKLKKDLEELQVTNESLERDKKILEHIMDNLKRCNESNNGEIEILKQANLDLKNDLTRKEEILHEITNVYTTSKDSFENKKLRYKGKKEKLSIEIFNLKQEIAEKDKHKFALEKEKDETIAHLNDKLAIEEENKQRYMKKMDDENKQYAEEIAKVQNELSDMISKYEGEKQHLKAKNDKLVTEQYEKQFLVEKANNKNKQLIEESEKVRNELLGKISKCEGETQNLKVLNEKIVAEKDAKQLYIEKTENEKKQLANELEKVQNELCEKISKYEGEIQNLKALNGNLVTDKNEKQLYIEKTDNEKKQLTKELEKIQNELCDKISKYESEKQKLISLNKVNQEKHEKEIHQANQNRENLKVNVQDLKTELDKREKRTADLKKSLEEKVAKLERNLESVTKEKDEHLRNFKKEKKSLIDTISAERTSAQHLKQALKEKESRILIQEKERNSLFAQLSDERDTLLKIKKECAYKDTELTEIQRHFLKSKERIKDLEKSHEHQARKIDFLQKELDLIMAKKIVPVQLYTHKRSEMTDNIEVTIKRLLQKEFVSGHLELDFWKCSQISDIRPNYPLLVICVTVSRIGTDVANAVHGISLSPNMAVMVFHHKDEHALPNQLSERILTGKELKDIGGIFDMAYFSGKGIYPCEMNRNSADSLVTFIKRVAKNIHQ